MRWKGREREKLVMPCDNPCVCACACVCVVQPVEVRLAREEERPKQDDEVPFFDAIIDSLSEKDRERAEADPLDVLIIVRGYAGEDPRMEATVAAMRKLCAWRDSVGYYEFFTTRLPGADGEGRLLLAVRSEHSILLTLSSAVCGAPCSVQTSPWPHCVQAEE